MADVQPRKVDAEDRNICPACGEHVEGFWTVVTDANGVITEHKHDLYEVTRGW